MGFPLHKPYPYSLYYGEDTSILGTNEMSAANHLPNPSQRFAKVRVNGLALAGASPHLRSRADFVYQAVCCDGRALVAVPEPLRSQKA